MADIDAVIRRYVASWNEPDGDTRRAVIDETWAPDGVYRNASTEFAGRDGVDRAVTDAYDAFSSQGFAFRVASVDRNHDAVRYRWEMVPVAGGEPDSIGTHVATLDADGLLQTDHQFIDMPPSSVS